jgi:hypothetical protein
MKFNKLFWFVLGLSLVVLTGAKITSDNLKIGRGSAEDITLEFDSGNGANNGFIKWSDTGSQIQFSNDGVNTQALGGGGGGGASGINVIENAGAEIGENNWTLTGAGSFTTTTAAANIGVGSASFDLDLANGDTLDSDQQTITGALQGRLCVARAELKGGDANIDMQVWDGSAVVAQVTLAATTEYRRASFTFVCPSSGTMGLRFAATAEAAQVYIDETFLGTTSQSSGVVVTDWQDFTPTWQNDTTWDVDVAKWRQVGENMEISMSLAVNTQGVGSETVRMIIPNGKSSTFIPEAIYGNGMFEDVGSTQNYSISVEDDGTDATYVMFRPHPYLTAVNRLLDSTVAVTDKLRVEMSIPIAEWQGKGTVNLMSDDVAYANAKAKVWGVTTTAIPSGGHTFDFGNTKYVEGFSYNAGTGKYTVLTSGKYSISAKVTSTTLLGPATTANINSSVGNLSARPYAANTTQFVEGYVETDLVAGQEVWFEKSGSATWTATATERDSHFSISRVSEFSASEAVGFGIAETDKYGLVKSTDGQYLPVITNAADFDSVTPNDKTGYFQIGNRVCVFAQMSFDVTATGNQKQFRMSLPVPSDLINDQNDAGGTAVLRQGNGECSIIGENLVDPKNVTFLCNVLTTSAVSLTFNFCYNVN